MKHSLKYSVIVLASLVFTLSGCTKNIKTKSNKHHANAAPSLTSPPEIIKPRSVNEAMDKAKAKKIRKLKKKTKKTSTVKTPPKAKTNITPSNDTKQTDSIEPTTPLSLTTKPWIWVETRLADGSQIAPTQLGRFILKFGDTNLNSSTDCNGLFASYTTQQRRLTIDRIASTRKACPETDSLESVYSNHLQTANAYNINSNRQLILQLKDNAGVMVFK